MKEFMGFAKDLGLNFDVTIGGRDDSKTESQEME